MKRIFLYAALALAALTLWPSLALAHAELVKSDPADGAQIALTNAPTSLTITFSEAVGQGITTIHLTGPDGSEMTNGAAQINFDNPALATVALKPLGPGKYTAKWHAVTTDDNGQTDGTFSFTIVNNTGGTTAGGTTTSGSTTSGGTTSGGTTTGGTTTGGTTTNTLPQSGAPFSGQAALLLGGLALLLLGMGLGLRRTAWGRAR